MNSKIKIGLFLILCLNSLNSIANEWTNSDSLIMFIENKVIEISKNDTVALSVHIKNIGSENYLFYAFQNIEDGITTEETYCTPNNPAGLAVLIEQDEKRVCPFLFDGYSDEDSPVTEDDVINTFEKVKKTYTETMLLLKSESENSVNISFDIEKFPLKTGHYKLYLIYFCGENLKNFVNKEAQTEDSVKYNAKIFSGCIKSNKIDLIIK